jgi:LysR family transcriptional regulator, regulator for genes of the gallate degradation pathway
VGAQSARRVTTSVLALAVGLRHLRVFLAVVDHGSVSQAAAALYRAQSAVSRSVRELEKEFGVPLFERRVQGMLPTRFGDALQHRARRAAAEFDAAGRDSERLPGSKARGGQALAMQLSDRRLRAFVELADVHHMPTVAEKLGVSQPAISLAIRELETALGLALFARTPKGMLPTAPGAALAARVKRAMAELRHARADIARLCGRIEGTISVGALPLGRTVLLPRAIARLLPAYPGLHVATVEGPFDTLAAALRSGDVDFILGALRHPGLATDFAGEALLADELAIVARADHPLCARRRVTWRELAGAQWVLPRKGAPTRDLFESELARRDIASAEVPVETSDLAVLRGVLLESDLITAISPRQLHYELRQGMVARLPLALPETSREIGITRRKGDQPSPGAALLMAQLRELAREFDLGA